MNKSKNTLIIQAFSIGLVLIFLLLSSFPMTTSIYTIFTDQYGTDYGAILVMNFEEGTGITTFDQSPYGNDGAIEGATWADGKYGEALTFDGNDYVNITDSTSLNISDYITIEAWAKEPPDSEGDNHRVIVEKDGAYAIYINETSILYAQINSTRVSYTIDDITAWHYYSMTYDNVTLSLLLDGELVNSTALTGAIATNVNNVTIGTRFLGEIDQVRIYNVAKTVGEIRNHYLNSGHMYSGSVIVSDDFRILNTSLDERIGLDDIGLDLNHYYILNSDFSHWMHFTFTAGVTDIKLNVVGPGILIQDRHIHRITLTVDSAPGAGREVNITLTNGVDTMFVDLENSETEDWTETGEFDWDVSDQPLTLTYSQSAGGLAEKGFVTVKYHYKETP